MPYTICSSYPAIYPYSFFNNLVCFCHDQERLLSFLQTAARPPFPFHKIRDRLHTCPHCLNYLKTSFDCIITCFLYTSYFPYFEKYSCANCREIFNLIWSLSSISLSESPKSTPVSIISSALPSIFPCSIPCSIPCFIPWISFSLAISSNKVPYTPFDRHIERVV